jgi:glycosyltransferase involved in cell wall biosynthesis
MILTKSRPVSEAGDGLRFLADFKRKMGRPLRVLHIGNIANNAYNNACIQRRYGIEADVICYNYYHIMGCPEWEDGSFRERSFVELDHFNPNWWATSIGGWSRPRWFAQGSSDLCINYLRAKNAGWKLMATLKWLQLEFEAWERAQPLCQIAGDPNNIPRRLKLHRWINSSETLRKKRGQSVYRNWLGTFVADGLLGHRCGVQAGVLTVSLSKISAVIWLTSRKLRRLYSANDRAKIERARYDVDECRGVPREKWQDWLRPIRFILRRAVLIKAPISKSGLIAASIRNEVDRLKEVERLTSSIRADPVDLDDESQRCREDYITRHPYPFAEILRHYDVIQGYSIDGFIPLINGIKNFVSYEHGTLRHIPFEKTLTGLVCRFSYKLAPKIFVTNSDVLSSCDRLGLTEDQITYLPHAFDDTKLLRFRAANPKLNPPKGGPILFFSPSRHDPQKGNSILIRAAGQLATYYDFKLILVEWGNEIAASKALISELNISSKVEWVQPMSKAALWAYYCSCHAVVDQFVLPALGGVGFETMVLGQRLITSIDREQTALFFGEVPPCLDAKTVEECAARMREVIEDPDDSKGRGEEARKWMVSYHSAERIVALQSKAYRALLTGQWENRRFAIRNILRFTK